ncbi:hypothetical protein CTAYLR_009828 [Chrysophaeum taylorii]|uniref:Prolyl 4-hydroxylase alpha subunit Fe(2+) 2OG dioxygenase domain-containing protein n=1 Tax=Chrysophaeum taylorii TaxID=2483200 RepID=A0AAD7UC18_9STRA|nr:hypothetical protein CTAYLR_009828 [Chrysophaeum taylorii]
MAVLLLLSAEAMKPQSWPRAFSEAECDAIEKLFFERCSVEVDERPYEGISRRNYWFKTKDMDTPEELGWILDRVASKVGKVDLEFALMHEFGPGNFFDWHVDTKPGDGTERTLNVNVVLAKGFRGGELQLGAQNASLDRGDMHVYPAALPHKVHDITAGRRRTLVLALRGENRETYFDQAPRVYEELCEDLVEPKLRWIEGDFYKAKGNLEIARAKYAQSYRSTSERDRYVDAFAQSAAQHHAEGRLEEAVEDLEMCVAIDPTHHEHATDLAVVSWLLGRPLRAERLLQDTLAASTNDSAKPALHAALSLVLRDLDRISEADRQEALAVQAEPDVAKAALDHLLDLRSQRRYGGV